MLEDLYFNLGGRSGRMAEAVAVFLPRPQLEHGFYFIIVVIFFMNNPHYTSTIS